MCRLVDDSLRYLQSPPQLINLRSDYVFTFILEEDIQYTVLSVPSLAKNQKGGLKKLLIFEYNQTVI